MGKSYDVVVVGAGSVGVPTAMSLAEKGLKTLVVETLASSGQGENKRALGGIRATHSNKSKIQICLRSLVVFRNWKKEHGDDIEWKQGGYIFPAWDSESATILKGILPMQKSTGMPIDFVSAEKVKEIVPGVNEEGLVGGTYSPSDGSASPMLAIDSFYRKAKEYGAEFLFRAGETRVILDKGKVAGVETAQGRIDAPIVINAAGAGVDSVLSSIGRTLPVEPDSHEAMITEPVAKVLDPMIVDIKGRKGSKNAYFYQNSLGQIIGCFTPDPLIPGKDIDETSSFLPILAQRMVFMIPKLRNIRVRRVWRGLYPMTPDGLPLFGKTDIPGLIQAAGMCGHGFMMGPGLGELAARIVTNSTTAKDKEILEEFDPNRQMSASGPGALK